MANKAKVEVEKTVFCVVEQTTNMTGKVDRYRTVIHRNLVNKTITIDKLVYKLVESEALKPSINAHAFREYCNKGNEQHRIEQGIKSKAEEQDRRQKQEQTWKANAAKREEERKAARKARYQERQAGIQQARPILREIAIRKRMMDEVQSGQQALPTGLRSVI